MKLKGENIIGNSSEIAAIYGFVEDGDSKEKLFSQLWDLTTKKELSKLKDVSDNEARKLIVNALDGWYSFDEDDRGDYWDELLAIRNHVKDQHDEAKDQMQQARAAGYDEQADEIKFGALAAYSNVLTFIESFRSYGN